MLQRTEKMFSGKHKEAVIETVILGNFVAEKKAYLNSHFILGMINHKNGKKNDMSILTPTPV